MSKQRNPKKAVTEDWHRADIVAALRKAGWSLRRLSTHHGYKSPTTLVIALDRHWPKGERLIAEALDIKPGEIWPTRYPIKGNTKSNTKCTTPEAA
ncbi:helix-turn-helix domain-containing protein [Sulfuriflexus mobilis]|uniref:helix-turn-helix domain-containing protein n=1 Tax=Sulfuriflexus mobilis TaxID=1811807 RepID=UPI000F834475|nr:helix-turn-helix transcriptional regulator [Sulfuriflexus mobilis]